jgi:hypothetical protein
VLSKGTIDKELRRIRSTAYRRVQEIRGKADGEATRVYAKSYSRNPEFYAFLRTLEVYGEGSNKNSVAILTTDSDFYRYLKSAYPRCIFRQRGRYNEIKARRRLLRKLDVPGSPSSETEKAGDLIPE